MYAKKNADKKIDIRTMSLIDYLNGDRSVYLAEGQSAEQRRRYVVKVIPLYSDSPQFQSSQEAIIRKLFTSSIYYFKPEFYDIRDNNVHLCCRIQPLSLQSLIWIHKKEGKVFSTAFVRDFTVRIFEGVARLKQSDIFPQNLKPSNIFLEIRSVEDRNWVWGEAGLHTTKRNQAYYKLNLQTLGKNSSINVDPFQIEFYSIAIILIEMITLQPSSDIDRILRKTGRVEEVENFTQAEDYYGIRFTKIVRLLLQPPKDSSLNKAIQEYKQSGEEEDNEQPDYEEYQFSEERLSEVLKDQLIGKISQSAKQHVKEKSLSARDIFDKLAVLDPQFRFSFYGIQQLDQLLQYLGVQLKSYQLLFAATYYTSMCQIKYFKVIQTVFPHKELIENIIVKAAQNYDSFKQFFESQTSGKDFWKTEEIKQFLQSLETSFEQKDVVETVKEWTKGGSKTSIKYAEIYSVFKPIIGMSLSLSTLKKPNANQSSNDGMHLLQVMMGKLKRKLQQDKGEDLITFFRKNDIKQNWTVDSKIYKIIKNYTKDKEFDEEKYRKAFLQMEKEGSIAGDMTKQINYVYLIRNLELEEPITLLRQIITQKINESHRDSFFQRYQKNEKGWTFQSLIELNKDEGLQFEDRQLRALFSEMDSDRSGTVQRRQLFYKLTNIKEFDYEFIVDSIRAKVEKEGLYLFSIFEEADPRARLVLSNPIELKKILEALGMELSEDHLHQFYNKFSKKGRFEYLVFLREFHPVQKIFLTAVQLILAQHYNNNFDKLYQIGLKDARKKWNLQSLELVNQQMALGFRHAELQEIWSGLDPNEEGSLTKEEVANIFSYEFVKTTELTTKAVESIKDLASKKKEEGRREAVASKKKSPSREKQKQEQNIIESFKTLGEKQLLALCIKLLNASPEHVGHIALDDCVSTLQDNGVEESKKQVSKLVLRFKQEGGRKISINFMQLFYFLIEHCFEKSEVAARVKATLTLQIIKEVKKLRSISNADLFHWCKKKDRMRLADFEQVMRRLLEIDIFFEDLQSVWQHWGDQDYYTEEDFDNLLQTREYKQKVERESSGREEGVKLEKKQSKKPKIKLGDDNRMRDFVNEEDEDTPYLKKPLSFGQKDPTFRKQNSNSFREAASLEFKNQLQQTPINKFKGDSTSGREKEREVKGLDKKKPAFPSKKPKQEKVQLEQYVKPAKQVTRREEKPKITFNRNQLLEKLRTDVAENGEQYISELFSRANIVDAKRLISCLTIHYTFTEEEATQLVDHLAKFDKIKLDTLKEYLYKPTPLEKGESKAKSKEKPDKNDKNRSGGGKEGGSGWKGEGEGKEEREGKGKGEREGKRIGDPRRQKINIPLVKQSIKSLKGMFCQRFQLNQMEPYFFGEKDTLNREDFISKCQSITTTFSTNICEKIFDYLKPDAQDRIVILSFKLGMGVGEVEEEEEQDYLPEQLEKQLKVIFEKADKDHSGYIEANQIEQLLSSLGFNESVKQIEAYFAKMDQNFDNRISYSQFRHFIEDQILPQISNYDEDEQELDEILRNNDIFRSGSLAPTTFQAVIESYGVKVTPNEIQALVRSFNYESTEIRINQFLDGVRQPSVFSGKAKSVLYKIRLRKKVRLGQIQKVFQNISSCFVLAYSPIILEKQILNISTPYRPLLHDSGLFYSDLSLRNAKKIGLGEQGLVGGEIGGNDILVEMALKEVNGVPIPQKAEVKANIVRRYLNIAFFDLSAEMLKHSIWQVEAEFDPEVEDVWRFTNAVRSLFIKVANYEPRKFQKIVLLFELVISVVEGNRTLQINCGCSTLPLRDLLVPEGKSAKKLKLIAGLPNRSKEIDKNSISKRSGWKNFFGGDVQSELQVELIHQNKFKEYHKMLAGLPPCVILGRKALHYLWIYREVMAEAAFDGNSVNPFLHSDLRILAFQLTLDIPQVFPKITVWWKDKVESKVKTLSDSKRVFKVLMQELYLTFHAKQFELIKRSPSKPILHNKSLSASRSKMLGDALENVENWVGNGIGSSFKRKKAYNYNYGALQLHEVELPKEHRTFMESIQKLVIR